jgi:hypothetical protein
MSSIPKNKPSITKEVPIDEIIKTIAGIEYSKVLPNIVDNTEKNKAKHSVRVDKSQKENLTKLVEALGQLRKTYVYSGVSTPQKISELYDLLSIKVGKDISLLNLKITVEFLHGYKSINSQKLNPFIVGFLNEIFVETNKKLKTILNEVDYNLISNNLADDEIEDKLQKVINSALNSKANDYEKNVMYIVLYTHFVLNNYTRNTFFKQLSIVERVFAEHISEIGTNESSDYLLNQLPEALLDAQPKLEVKKFIHLYSIEQNKKLTNDFYVQSNQIQNLDKANGVLRGELSKIREQHKESEEIIVKLTQSETEKSLKIAKLEQELADISQHYKYENNNLKLQLKALKSGMVSKLQKDLQMELDGITAISERVSQDEGVGLKIYVKNILQLLNLLKTED